KAEVVLLVGVPLRDALLGRGLRRRGHLVRQRGHAPGIHLPLRERGQVLVTHAAQSHPLADQDRVAVAECAGNIGEFGHVPDTAACQSRDETRFWPHVTNTSPARSANVAMPITANMSCAVRSSCRAFRRRDLPYPCRFAVV